MNARKGERGTVGIGRDDGGPSGCSEKGEKRRKSTARRNLSDLSFILPFRVKPVSREGEVKPQGTKKSF